MRKLVVGTFVTLDGVMQAPGGPDEDREGGFRHGGWLVPYFDEKLVEIMTEWSKRAGAFLFGRKTYERLGAFWPHQSDENPMAAHLNRTPKYVASRTLTGPLAWQGSTLVAEVLAEARGRLQGAALEQFVQKIDVGELRGDQGAERLLQPAGRGQQPRAAGHRVPGRRQPVCSARR